MKYISLTIIIVKEMKYDLDSTLSGLIGKYNNERVHGIDCKELLSDCKSDQITRISKYIGKIASKNATLRRQRYDYLRYGKCCNCIGGPNQFLCSYGHHGPLCFQCISSSGMDRFLKSFSRYVERVLHLNRLSLRSGVYIRSKLIFI
jgi:hypothetical protein